MKIEVYGSWAAAELTRLTRDWGLYQTQGGIDADIRTQLAALRVRAQDQVQNNPWAKRLLVNLRNNIVGANPTLQVKYAGKNREAVEDSVERAWFDYGSFGVPTVRRDTTLKQLFRDAVQAVAREGEYIVRVHRDYPRNRFGFALEVVDPSLLAVELNTKVDGLDVVMGVGKDGYGAPVAYFFRADSEPDLQVRVNGTVYTRIPAVDVIHLYLPEWSLQTRGVPWLATGLVDAKMLAGSREAELVATRACAGKLGFFTETGPAQYTGTHTDSAGHLMEKAEAGTFTRLPPGVGFVAYDPQHPNGNYGDFERRILYGLAVGWGDAYHSLTGDYSNVNYSSLRQANLEIRDHYKILQDWFGDFFAGRVFSAWLGHCLAGGLISGPYGKPLRPSVVDNLRTGFQFPRWDWIDPAKESKANDTDIANGTRTQADVIRQRGLDPDEVFAERREERLREARLALEVSKIIAGEPSNV